MQLNISKMYTSLSWILLITTLCITDAFEIDLICETIEDREWDDVNTVRTCTNKNIEVRTRDTKISQLLDKFGNDLTDVYLIEALAVQDTDMNFIPKGLKAACPKLKALSLRNTGIKSVKREDLQQFGNDLELISFRACYIIALDSNIFADNPNLKFISFQSNHLRYIESGFFSNVRSLNKLEVLNFIDCKCINRFFTPSNLSQFNEKSESRCTDANAVNEDVDRLNTLEENERPNLIDVRVDVE